MFKLKVETSTEKNNRIREYLAKGEIFGIRAKIQSVLVAIRPNTLTLYNVQTTPVKPLRWTEKLCFKEQTVPLEKGNF